MSVLRFLGLLFRFDVNDINDLSPILANCAAEATRSCGVVHLRGGGIPAAAPLIACIDPPPVSRFPIPFGESSNRPDLSRFLVVATYPLLEFVRTGASWGCRSRKRGSPPSLRPGIAQSADPSRRSQADAASPNGSTTARADFVGLRFPAKCLKRLVVRIRIGGSAADRILGSAQIRGAAIPGYGLVST